MSWRMPEKTDWAREMNEHEPTRVYGEEIHDVVKAYSKGRAMDVLEIGAAWGVSAAAILMANDKISLTSVDKDETAKAPSEVEANGWTDRHTFVLQTSDAFFAQNKKKFDVIYVDGSHLFENVHPDFFNAWDALKPGGLFIADDFTHMANRKVDTNGQFSEYGVSLALWMLIVEKNITKINTTTRLFYAVKP